jgi:hypothetical protein
MIAYCGMDSASEALSFGIPAGETLFANLQDAMERGQFVIEVHIPFEMGVRRSVKMNAAIPHANIVAVRRWSAQTHFLNSALQMRLASQPEIRSGGFTVEPAPPRASLWRRVLDWLTS